MVVESVLRMEGQRNETLESARFILKLTQADHVIDAFFKRFDMSVEHRRIRTDAHLMDGPRDLQPSCARDLMTGDQGPRALGKNLRAASGATAQARFAKPVDDPFQWLSRDLGKEIELDHGERFEVHGRKTLTQTAQQIRVISEWQLGIQAAHNVELRQRIRALLLGKMEHLLQSHGVSTLFAGLARVRALTELAIDDTHIGVIDVTVDVVEGDVPVEPFSCVIGQTAKGKNVLSPVERNSVLEGEALTAFDLFGDGSHLAHRHSSIQP